MGMFKHIYGLSLFQMYYWKMGTLKHKFLLNHPHNNFMGKFEHIEDMLVEDLHSNYMDK